MSIIISDSIKIKPKEIRIQIRERRDGGLRYVCNLPKGFMDRIIKKYFNKKGTYVIDCVKLVIIDGEPFLRINETEEMI